MAAADREHQAKLDNPRPQTRGIKYVCAGNLGSAHEKKD
jgi:hypothetical protein